MFNHPRRKQKLPIPNLPFDQGIDITAVYQQSMAQLEIEYYRLDLDRVESQLLVILLFLENPEIEKVCSTYRPKQAVSIYYRNPIAEIAFLQKMVNICDGSAASIESYLIDNYLYCHNVYQTERSDVDYLIAAYQDQREAWGKLTIPTAACGSVYNSTAHQRAVIKQAFIKIDAHLSSQRGLYD